MAFFAIERLTKAEIKEWEKIRKEYELTTNC